MHKSLFYEIYYQCKKSKHLDEDIENSLKLPNITGLLRNFNLYCSDILIFILN